MKPLYYYLPEGGRDRIETFKLLFIAKLHDLNPTKRCWADCVSWAMSSRWKWWKIEKPCNHVDEKPCYCGQWYGGKCLNKMTEAEIEEIRNKI